MIVFDLKCGKDHVFEAWFRDGAAFDDQANARRIRCPECGDARVAKAPMAPAIARGAAAPAAPAKPDPGARALGRLRAMHDFVEKTFDHVGPRFPEEARKIHYGEAEKRNIYGNATAEEARALADEDIAFGVLPPLPRHDA